MIPAVVWLKQSKAHPYDVVWFNSVANEIYADSFKGLSQYGRKENYTRLLLAIEPLIPTQRDLVKWRNLLLKAVEETRKAKDKEVHCRIMVAAGNLHRLLGEVDQAEQLYNRAMKYGHEHGLAVGVIESYAGLLTLTQYRAIDGIHFDQITDMLVYRPDLRLPATSANLYLAIANACKQWGRFQIALDYARLAYDYSSRMEDPIQIARSAKIIAECYLRQDTLYSWDEATSWIEIASRNFEKTSYIWQYGEISYLRGIMFFYLKKYDTSIQHLTHGINQSNEIGNNYLLGILHHTLACVLVMQEKLEEAYPHLDIAVDFFIKVNSTFQLIHASYTKAYVVINMGDHVYGRKLINETIEKINNLTDLSQQNLFNEKFKTLTTRVPQK